MKQKLDLVWSPCTTSGQENNALFHSNYTSVRHDLKSFTSYAFAW